MLNLLVAYPYLKKEIIDFIKDHEHNIRFVLDSGAFTAWKSGNPIKLDDYCRFIETLPFKPWRYFTLDVVGDPKATFENYQIMRSRGFNPVPIFTRGDDVAMIDEYYKTSDVVGIGGLVGTQGNKGFVKGIMNIIGERKVHWLGFTNLEFVRHYRPYMCDSSSWLSSARFASFKLYAGRGKFVPLTKKNFLTKPSKQVMDLISSYGMNPADFSINKNWQGAYGVARVISALSIIRYSLELEKLYGVKQFSAITVIYDIKHLYNSYIKERK